MPQDYIIRFIQAGVERHRFLQLYLRDPQYVCALNLIPDTDKPQTDDTQDTLIHSVVYAYLRRPGFYRNDSTDIEQPVQY